MNSIGRMIITLVIVSMISGLVLAFTFDAVYPRILTNQEEKFYSALKELFPESEEFEEIKEGETTYYRAIKDGQELGVAGSFIQGGFNGDINFVLGVDTSGKVTGVKILNHLETPGLGARITEDFFIGQFKGKKVDDPFILGEDIDGISGATISSSSITSGIRFAAKKLGSIMNGLR